MNRISNLRSRLATVIAPPERESRGEKQSKSDSIDDYDGPRFGEPVKVTLMFGPEEGVGVMPIREGGIYITPDAVYQRRDGEYVKLDADARPLFRAMAAYVDPQQIREQQMQQQFDF